MERAARSIESCTVLTTAASADLEGVHHRMPVILAPDRLPIAGSIRDRISSCPEDDDALGSRPERSFGEPVGRAVNNARFDDASCLEEVDDSDSITPVTADQGELFANSSKDRE